MGIDINFFNKIKSNQVIMYFKYIFSAFGFMAITVIYLLGYLHYPARPSPAARFPEGWWGWFDQSKYLQSAQAISHWDLSPAQHWYPFGYALLGAPFVWMGNNCYLLPDLLCLLATVGAIIFLAEGLGLSVFSGMLIAIGTTVFPAPILSVWVVPWNTTLSVPLIWWAFALATRLVLLKDAGRLSIYRLPLFVLLGALLAFIPVTRPTDLLISGGVAATCFLTALWERELRWRELLAAVAGATVVLGIAGALYVQIYGFHASEYMVHSKELGFRTDLLWWKTYLLLLTPRPWFPDGEGLMEQINWLFFGIAGIVMLPWTARSRKDIPYILLACLCIGYSLLFFSYIDLIPSGLWRYNNVHYFKWVLPAMGLLAWRCFTALFSPRWRVALGTIAAVFVLSCIRLLPVQVPNGSSGVWMLTLHEAPPSWPDSYFRDMTVADQDGKLANITGFRSLPDTQGERWIALARPFDGVVRNLTMQDQNSLPVTSWGMKLALRPNPCWLPPYACHYKAPAP
ncbi:hypothetical protein M2305_002743 [Gluconobacter cerinus]|uniref:hypothetical protein n=1 Tax=Gluconobacter cerinus TaxID=38307 RepID=UPI002225C09D|nr:hypothetical protein [Gluconobacter cerinus]MCW2266796.1 hypothetical protein [Gluconobacter cerinus]